MNEQLNVSACKTLLFFPASKIFEEKALPMFKQKKLSHGRIWSCDVNGGETTCGLVATDQKIKVWRNISGD